jgi:hypothetical protein
MGRGGEALLEVWRALLDLFSESFEYKKKMELVQISIQMRIYAVGGRADVLPSAPVNQFLNKIKKGNFIHKKGVITKEKPIAPKADLSA